MKKQAKLMDAADRYMKAATKRFSKGLPGPSHELFVNGFTWGAHAGYIAGFRAATKRKRS